MVDLQPSSGQPVPSASLVLRIERLIRYHATVGVATFFRLRPARSVLRCQTDVSHEQRIDARVAERGDRMGRCAYDWLAVVE